MKERKSKLVGLALALLLFGALLVAISFSMNKPTDLKEQMLDDVGNIKIGLRVEAKHPDGSIFAERYLPDDLPLSCFGTILKGILTDHHGAAVTYNDYDTGHALLGLTVKTSGSGTASPWIMCTGASSLAGTYCGGYILIGNGTTGAVPSDYSLQTQVNSARVLTSAYSNGNVTVSSSVTVTTTQTNGISEVGLAGLFTRSASNANYFMLFRDVFTAIPCSVSDTISVTYIIQLASTGFNDNFGTILAHLLMSWYYQSNNQITITDVTGASKTVYGYSLSQTSILFDVNTGAAGCNGHSGIEVGTDDTAETRADYDLGTNVTGIAGNDVPVYTSDTHFNVTLSSNIIMGSNYDIVEAGYFLIGKDTTGANFWYMIWRVTFSTYSYTASDVMACTFKVRG